MRQKILDETKHPVRDRPADMKVVTFKIETTLRQKTRSAALVKGVKIGDVVSEAIAQYVEEVMGGNVGDHAIEIAGHEKVQDEEAMEVL